MSDFPFKKKPWKTLGKTHLLKTPIFDLYKNECRPPDQNRSGDFYVLEARDWTNILPLTEKNEVILVEQYRHGVDRMSLELPGGIIDPGEEPIEAAARELEEETGYRSGEWSYIGNVSSNPAILTNHTHFFLARNCQASGIQDMEPFEDIAVHLVPMDNFLDRVRDGTIHHTIVVAAVAKYLLLDFPKS